MPRVLVISHNVFSGSTNMGKTLASMLSCVPEEDLAQLYFHSEVPTLDLCSNYYRVTDRDVLRSLATRQSGGTVLGEDDICPDLISSRTDNGIVSRAYCLGRRRTPFIYFLRNALWRVGVWNGAGLRAWLKDFAPEVIFFASGDYSFAYEIAYRISCDFGAPIVMWCCDDYYLGDWPSRSLSGRLCRRGLAKSVQRIQERVKELVVISDEMARDYSRLFACPIRVMRIAAEKNPSALPPEERFGIVYAGGLGVGRAEVLAGIGQVLAEARVSGYDCVDVYTGDRDERLRSLLRQSAGVRLHNALSRSNLQKLLGRAKYLLHVESFDAKFKARTKYSLSTKIGESLQSGACMIAYGPSDLASIAYLSNADAAAIAHDPKDVPSLVRHLEQDASAYETIVVNARTLAKRCHSKTLNDAEMLDLLLRASGRGVRAGRFGVCPEESSFGQGRKANESRAKKGTRYV